MAVWNVINHTELGSDGATLVDWTSISSSYDHLIAMLSTRADSTAIGESFKVQLNGDTSATDYSYTNMYGDGTTTIQQENQTGQATVSAYPRMLGTGDGLTNNFSGTRIYFFDYSNTDKFKSVLTENCAPSKTTGAGQGYIYLNSGLWADTSAINQITITASSNDFESGSTATLYGINGVA